MIVLRENNPHRLDGKKYSNFGNSPINYKTKMMQNNGFAMPSSHLPFFEGRQGYSASEQVMCLAKGKNDDAAENICK